MSGKNSHKLQVTLPSDTEIELTRVFDAPRHLVFEAMTKPEHVRRWWCCMDGFTMPVCDIDFRVGGKWRFLMISAEGQEVGFSGVYHEIDAPVRIVNTEIFDPFPDNPAMVTVTLEEREGKTYYKSRVVHDSKASRDAHVDSGMEVGAGIALDRLEDVARGLGGSPHATSGASA
jgi:uncharacterized protein YndB with AHSA1/START domain